MPLSVIGLLASNSAENEWCACTAPAVSINAARMPPNRYLLIFAPSSPAGRRPLTPFFSLFPIFTGQEIGGAPPPSPPLHPRGPPPPPPFLSLSHISGGKKIWGPPPPNSALSDCPPSAGYGRL